MNGAAQAFPGIAGQMGGCTFAAGIMPLHDSGVVV
jgi:hypothetical protein